MKVSLIVPAYNEEKSLAKTLESLCGQTYSDVELIVIDNNSTDKTNSIAKKYTENVRIETRKGYMHAVSRGAQESHGDLISFCDADTLYPPQWVEQIVTEFTKNPQAVAVYGSCKTHDASPWMNNLAGCFYTLFLIVSRWCGLDNTSGFNFVIKRDIFFRIGGYDPNFKKMSPDIELGKRLKKEGPIIFNPNIIVLSSFRRFQHGGVLKTTLFFLKSWWQMLRGKQPTVSYEDYNKEIR